MNPIGPSLDTRVLATVLTDVRATIAQTQAVQATQEPTSVQQTADVILDLSTAAQQLLAR